MSQNRKKSLSDPYAREKFMTPEQRRQMSAINNGNSPRTHTFCHAMTGVNRPGKTAQDRARRIKAAEKAAA